MCVVEGSVPAKKFSETKSKPMLGGLNELQIDVKKSVPQESKGRARKIFVGGLSPDTTEG